MSGVIKIAGVEFYDSSQKIIVTYDSSINLLKLSDREYRYDQLESYEYVENQGTIAKGGGVGRALIGGALFGNVGAVVGATTAKRSMDTVIRDMDVRMTFRVDGVLKTEKVTLNQYSNKIKYGSMTYERYLDKAKQLIDKLDQIYQQMNSTVSPINDTVQPAIDMKAKLLELKELYEQGLLDEQEYKDEKKALLESQRNVPQAVAKTEFSAATIEQKQLSVEPETVSKTEKSYDQHSYPYGTDSNTNIPLSVKIDGRAYIRQSIGIISIDKATDLSWRKNEQESFNMAVKIMENTQEEAWRNMSGSSSNENEYIIEAVQKEILRRIALLAKDNKGIALKDNNTKLYEIAKKKLSSYMGDDALIAVVDQGLFGHDFKVGVAIGCNQLYVAKNTKKGEVYKISFRDVEKLRPNSATGSLAIDEWIINDESNLRFAHMGVVKPCDVALIVGLIIIRSYIANGSEYILKLEN